MFIRNLYSLFKKALDPSTPFRNVSYSQEGEDLILKKHFGNKENGFFVDIGAHHPFRFSNTYLFYKNGWRGINIDAMPGSMELFKKYRSEDINLETAISDINSEFDFYIFNESALNTFNKEEAIIKSKIEPYKIESIEQIRTYTLGEILDAHLPKHKHIDFISIDVEGLDMQVLLSNDWDKYKPSMILVEDLRGSIEDVFDKKMYRFLNEIGYKLTARTINTMFFSLY